MAGGVQGGFKLGGREKEKSLPGFGSKEKKRFVETCAGRDEEKEKRGENVNEETAVT